MKKLRPYGVPIGLTAGMVAGGAAYLLWFVLFEAYLLEIEGLASALFGMGAIFALIFCGPAWMIAHRYAPRTMLMFVGVGVLNSALIKCLSVGHALLLGSYDELTVRAMRRYPLQYWSEQIAQPIILGVAVGAAIFVVAYHRGPSKNPDVF